MAEVGAACLLVGVLAAVYAAAASLYGVRSGRREFVASGRHAMYALAGLMILAVGVLELSYARTDLSLALVAENSSRSTPAFYKLTAMWSSQAGSLLLWAFLLSVYSSLMLFATRRRLREIAPYATAVLGGLAAFFICLMLIYASPFETLATPPPDGNGLNPLLRNPAMMIHPPMLYAGYVGFSIPFAFGIGALITRRTGADWLRSTRRFTLVAWTFLGCGILLGALWSYSELGWGGYWAWDAVENASLMPWLTGTAFLHSIMVQERRGMLRVWNAALIIGTFVLALLGTFLVRSGVLDSIHAFGASTLGTPFLIFIATVLVASAALLLSRLPDLRSDAHFDSLLSREAVFLLNNLVLVGLCFVIFWGTFFPLISEAVTGTKASVGPPWFDRYTTPLALVLVLLTGLGPTIAWRRITAANLWRGFAIPMVAAAATLAVLLLATPAAESVPSLFLFCLVAFTVAVAGQEFWRGTSARRRSTGEAWPVALAGLVVRNRQRYGGYVVHVGIAVVFLGVAGSSAFAEQRDVRLAPGQSTEVNGYRITYREPTAHILADPSGTGAPVTLGAILDVKGNGDPMTLTPSRNYYGATTPGAGGPIAGFFEGESTSEVDLRWGLSHDLWTVVRPDLQVLAGRIREADRKFGGQSQDVQGLIVAALADSYRREPTPAVFRVLISPLVAWIWIGGGIVAFGALTALWPAPGARARRVRSLYAARVGRELSRA